ncbi:translation initiation factor IF-3, mitochondrial-like isoform X2 [Homarus americanus]|uniref:translation initiation factor IF-3, mitochondrial-like isoform X2 n=1 Tax=Homarus americanus TaxID=6706 RepID=UPI001C44ACAC|nr:translation initiation factor IF-3, mitochondrial-like isoform X2 [Homarus americanus]
MMFTYEKVSSVSLTQAERMAKRRDLKLVKVEDPSLKSQDKQVYKLMTGKQYFEEEVKAKKSSKSSPSSKGEKILTMSGKIAAHDLKPKLQSIHKWLDKGHQIRVTVTSRGATKGDLESVYGTIEQEVKSNKGRVLQLREKFGDFKFTIVPSKVEKTSNQTLGESSERTHDSDHNVTH